MDEVLGDLRRMKVRGYEVISKERGGGREAKFTLGCNAVEEEEEECPGRNHTYFLSLSLSWGRA